MHSSAKLEKINKPFKNWIETDISKKDKSLIKGKTDQVKKNTKKVSWEEDED